MGNVIIWSGAGLFASGVAWMMIEPSVLTTPFGQTPDYYELPYYLLGIGASTVAAGIYVRQFSDKTAGFEVKLTGGVPVSEKKENDHG